MQKFEISDTCIFVVGKEMKTKNIMLRYMLSYIIYMYADQCNGICLPLFWGTNNHYTEKVKQLFTYPHEVSYGSSADCTGQNVSHRGHICTALYSNVSSDVEYTVQFSDTSKYILQFHIGTEET